jgi:two-component system, response regulator FlrC
LGPTPEVYREIIPAPGKYSAQLRVLVVEDETLIRWALVETLALSGHATIEAADKASALRQVSQNPDIILLDFRLPDSDDLELLSMLKARAPDSAVVMMTAHFTPALIQGAIRCGVHRILQKPFEMQELPAIIDCANRSRPV